MIVQPFYEDFRASVIAEIAPGGSPEVLEMSTRRLERRLRARRPVLAGVAVIGLYLAALATAVWLIVPFPGVFQTLRTFGSPGMVAPENPTSGDDVMDGRTRLLLYGDPDAPDNAAKWRALWMSEPENPAWFSRYVAHRLSEEKALDPELLAEALRLDADNGFWPLIAACIDAGGLIEKADLPESGDEEPKTGWFAKDEGEVLLRLARIREAASKPRLESHHRQWYREALSKHPPVDGYFRQIQLITLLAGETIHGGMNLRNLPGLQEAGIRIAIERGDAALAAAIIEDWHELSRRLAQDAVSLVEILIAHTIAAHPVEAFQEAAVRLDLDREAALLEPIAAAAKIIDLHRRQPRSVGFIDDFRRKGSVLAGLSADIGPSLILDPPAPPGVEALRPSRRLECAFYERLMVVPVALGLVVALVIFGAAWLWAGRSRRALAKRALVLMPWWKPAGLCLLAGAGPLLGYLILTRLTPLGWRWPGGIEPRAHGSLMLVLALPASGLILLRDLPGLSRHPWLPQLAQWLAVLVPAGIALGGLWCWWRQRKSPKRKTPRRLAAGLLAAHARLLAVALLVPWVLWTHHEEKSWTARDTLFAVDPENPALSSHEAAIQTRLRQQVLDMLGPAWSD